MKQVLTDFWGDALEIDDDAALTWMRQSHYYMGLYSYTYSAGLVLSTAGFLKLKETKEPSFWLDFLKLGGSQPPLQAAQLLGADLTTEKPLRDTIRFLDQTVQQIIQYSREIGQA